MDIDRNTFPITFEPVRKLLIAAYHSGDFSSVDAVIVRNTVKQTAMVWKLMNGSVDAYCWSSGQAVAHMLSRTSHPDTCSSSPVSSEAMRPGIQISNMPASYACRTEHARWAWSMRAWVSRASWPRGSASISRPMHMSGPVALETHSITVNPSSRVRGMRTAKYRTASVRRLHGNQPQYLPHRFRAR